MATKDHAADKEIVLFCENLRSLVALFLDQFITEEWSAKAEDCTLFLLPNQAQIQPDPNHPIVTMNLKNIIILKCLKKEKHDTSTESETFLVMLVLSQMEL